MRTLDVRRDPAADGCASTELDRLAAGMRWAHPELSAPLVLPWSDEPVLALDGGDPWLYGPVERDPMARDGRTVLPRAQRRRLADFARRGVPFQRVAIAHQLDPAGPVAALMPVLRRGPRLCTDAVARAVSGPVPPSPGAVRTLGILDGVLRGSGHTIASFAEELLDPIVFGIMAPTVPAHGEPCLWFPVAAWRW